MNWHILDPLGGEEWVRFMCGVRWFEYDKNDFSGLPSVNFTIPGKPGYVVITTGREIQILKPEMNWYRIHCNSQSSPFIQIGQASIRPEQAELAVRHFELLTGLTLTF